MLKKVVYPLVLGIETSCDETSIGIVQGREILSNIIFSSVNEHVKFGGIVPEIATRAHLENIKPTLQKALKEADVNLADIDAIAVTAGPGLTTALSVGISAAKGIAVAIKKPIYGVNHLIAHISACILDDGFIPKNFIAVLVSGGHTDILKVESLTSKITQLGYTLDDAAGEAFDKVARILNLGYPGGPAIDNIAKRGNPNSIYFPRSLKSKKDLENNRYNFSFSGLKTATIRWAQKQIAEKKNISIENICASFQDAVADILSYKAILACKENDSKYLFMGGGVIANSRIRYFFERRCQEAGITLRMPKNSDLCTDNGAMVAALGAQLVIDNVKSSDLNFGPNPSLSPTKISL